MIGYKAPQIQLNEEMWSQPLIQVLRKQISIHTLTVALSKSRHEVLSAQLAGVLQQLISGYGQNWRQVARRLIVNNYRMGFENGINLDEIFPILISEFHNLSKDNGDIQMYHRQIWQKVSKCYGQYWNSGKNERVKTKYMLYTYMQAAISHNYMPMLNDAFNLIAAEPRVLMDMLLPIRTNNEQELNNNSKQGIERVFSTHRNSIQLLFAIVRLAQKMQNQAVRHLCVEKYQAQLGANKPKIQAPSMYAIVCNALPTVIQILSSMPSLLYKQSTTNMFNTNTKCSSDIVQLLSTQKQNTLSDYFTDICKIILYYSQVTALQPILRSNRKLMLQLIDAIKAIDIVRLNRYHNLNQQLISINNQISAKVFSDTLSGTLMRMVIRLCNNVGGFFNCYLAMLSDMHKHQLFIKSSVSQFITYLLKLSLLSDAEILRHRLDDLQPLLMGTAKQFEQNWASYDEWQKIQILRYLLVFVGTDSDENRAIKFTQSGQEMISKCISLCLQSLCDNRTQSQNDDIQLSPLQMQCYDILLSLPEQANTFRIIKHSLLQTILDLFIKLPNNSLICLELFHKYITCLPELVMRSSQIILQYFHDAFMREVESLNQSARSSGRKSKSTQKITKIISAIHTILECNQQQRFEDIEDLVVYPILSKLCESNSISYEQQLLDLLDVLLVKHHHFTPQVVIVLSKLPVLYEKNEKKLSIFRNVYKGLVAESIKKQILYEYSDVIMVMLQLFMDYTANSLSINQFMFYTDQVRQLLFNVQLFLQSFSQRLLQDNQLLEIFGIGLYKNICNCIAVNKEQQLKIQSLNNKQADGEKLSLHRQFHELLIQYIMTITHICIAPNANSFNSHQILKSIELIKETAVANYVYIQTLKMIPIIFIDQLIINPDIHEQVLSDVLRYCEGASKMEIEGGMDRNWKTIDNVNHWEHWPSRAKDYIDNVLRQMRNRRKIDQVDHAQYVNALSKYLR